MPVIDSKLKVFYIAFLTGALFSSCSKIELDKIQNLNNGKIDVIGHGGAGFQSLINPYPTNSMASIEYAVDGLNIDGLEIDVQISADSVMVLYHDQSLEQSTNCAGCVKQYTASRLRQCEYFNQYGFQTFDNAHISGVQTFLERFGQRSKKLKIFTNLKITSPCQHPYDAQYRDFWAQTVATTMAAYHNSYDIYVYDRDIELLNTVRLYNPDVEIVYDATSGTNALEICQQENYRMVMLSNHDISKEEIAQLHAQGIKVILWEILLRKDAVEAINKNPDGIIADNIPLVQQCLQEF